MRNVLITLILIAIVYLAALRFAHDSRDGRDWAERTDPARPADYEFGRPAVRAARSLTPAAWSARAVSPLAGPAECRP